MIIPNYVPEPVEVPGNVHDQPYSVRVIFNRQVVIAFAVTWFVASLAALALPQVEWNIALPVYLGWCLVLGLVRLILRGSDWEAKVSVATWPLTVGCLAMLLEAAPVNLVPYGLAIATLTIYTLGSGHDFSFPRAFLLMWLVILSGTAALDFAWPHLAYATVFAYYVVYDLWCIQYRRQPKEVMAGAVDICRDMLNVLGWIVRVIAHWRKYHLWTDVQEDLARRLHPEA